MGVDGDSYCSVKFTVTVMITGTGWPFSQRRRELPLAHRVDRGLVQHRDRAQHPGAADRAVRLDPRFDDHDTLNPRILRVLRIRPG